MQSPRKRGQRGGANNAPGYLKHKDRKRGARAYVVIDGSRIYLGDYGSPESREAYDREIARWLANGRKAPAAKPAPVNNTSSGDGTRVVEIIEAFWKHAKTYYRFEDGTPTGSSDRSIRYALRPVRLLFADFPVAEFGPASLETVRNYMIAAGLARKVINQRIDIVKRMFRWAESRQLVARGTWHNLTSLEPLKAGRSDAPETDPVEPVAWEHVEATLPHLPPMLAAMVLLQWRTGMRPGEIVAMREADIDKSGETWIYRPRHHKTKHKGIKREVPLLAEACAILEPFLGAKREFLFVASGHKAKAVRYTTSTYSQAVRRGAAAASAPGRHDAILAVLPEDVRHFFANKVRQLTAQMSRARLAGLVERIATRKGLDGKKLAKLAVAALEKHKDAVPAWSPNQLRHAAATRIANGSRLEDARIVLGHTDPRTTLRYVKPDLQRAIDAMKKLG
jgi:integrase